MTIREALTKGMIILKNNNVETPKLKARLLLQYILKKPRQYLIVYDNKEIDKKEQWEYFVNIEKLTNGVPLQHITHTQEFMKMDFFVNENVLIPRPDTEILVEEVIKIAKKIEKPRILDLCTGSGAIAISIAKNIPTAEVYAIDISEKALEVAKKNANRLDTNVKFVKSNLFSNIGKVKFDIIVSNPPYIKTKVIEELDKQVKNEPYIALDGGADGLKFYKIIIENAYKYIKNEGKVFFEIGYDQKNELINLFKKNNHYENIYSKKDLGGNDRIIVATVRR